MLRSAAALAMLALSISSTAAKAQMPAEAERHAAAGLAAAVAFPGYANLCDLSKRMRNVNAVLTRSAKPDAATGRKGEAGDTNGGRTPPLRLKPDLLPPMQVFDNLFFLGTPGVSAWLYGTEEGYILIDALNNDEDAEKYILGGMAALGLNPTAIKLILVTHAHGDHYGGADYLADALGIEIAMSAADWDLAAKMGDHPRFGPPPKPGLTVKEGETLKVGTSSLTIHVTPGHTPGTISPIFEVFDGGVRHAAMLWGGTGFNFGPDVKIFETYAASAREMRQTSRSAGVDVFLSNHPRRDESNKMMAQLRQRQTDAPHPFVKGEAGFTLFTVLEECALAQAARFKAVSE